MGRLTRVVGGVAAALLLFVACSDGDEPAEAPEDTSADSIAAPTTQPPETGGLDVPELPGTFVVALPSVGFGIAVPEGWQATVLTDEALARLEDAALARPAFLDAAKAVAADGAVFYAAGVDEDERVAELKVDVQDDADTSPEAVAALAEAVAEQPAFEEVTVTDRLDDGRVRVDYRFSSPAADGEDRIDAYGSQLFVPDGDRLWSFIVTSEDRSTQDALLSIFGSSITF